MKRLQFLLTMFGFGVAAKACKPGDNVFAATGGIIGKCDASGKEVIDPKLVKSEDQFAESMKPKIGKDSDLFMTAPLPRSNFTVGNGIVVNSSPANFVIGETTISPNGHIEFKGTPDEAAKRFADALEKYIGMKWGCGPTAPTSEKGGR